MLDFLKNRNFVLSFLVFSAVAFLLTFKTLTIPSPVIGDSFYWNKSAVTDILGPRVIRESFMGDFAILSTFKNGFLFPLLMVFNYFGLVSTLIYPFLFYLLSMIAFYSLSKEFLSNFYLRIIISVLYIVNPVTPYYFATLLFAFALVFLPLALKFFFRALRNIGNNQNSSKLSCNIVLSAVFLGLCISAHEQFLPSAVLVASFLVGAFLFLSYQKFGLSRRLFKIFSLNLFVFAAVIALVNIPLLLSLNNLAQGHLSAYFTGNFQSFLANVKYSYNNANIVTLLRLGGDAGVGLGQNSWLDAFSLTNLFGYALPVFMMIVFALFLFRKKELKSDAFLFYISFSMFCFSFLILLFVGYLPSNNSLAERLYNVALQTWESPTKLRAILLISLLITTMFGFKKLENWAKTYRKRIISVAFIGFLLFSVVIYNSPWLLSYYGSTPLQQISDTANWGALYDNEYSSLSDYLEENFGEGRGLLIPYSHKSELYLPSNFRLFQLVSAVNDPASMISQGPKVPWSKILGLFSAKYLTIGSDTPIANEGLLFPRPIDGNFSNVLETIKSDSGFEIRGSFGNYSVFENQNSLPLLYATKYYVFYDDTSTLRHAVGLVNFTDLPVFIGSGQINELRIPNFVKETAYEIKALCYPRPSGDELTLIVSNNGSESLITLKNREIVKNFNVFSTVSNLLPGDILKVNNSGDWTTVKEIEDLVLDSSSYSLGTYDSFTLNFTVSMLETGEFSFLSPRVLIDCEGLTKYFLIFHDNGALELATMYDDHFVSNVLATYLDYNLKSENNKIEVSISRIFDEVQVRVGDRLELSFPTETATSTVSLISELSTSKFTDIIMQTKNVIRLFAARHFSDQVNFSVQQIGPERSVLEVTSGDSDYAVVVQYLNTPLRFIQTEFPENAVIANVFFNGWIIDSTDSPLRPTTILMEIKNFQISVGLTYLSIFLAYSLLIVGMLPVLGKRLSLYLGLLKGKIEKKTATSEYGKL